MLEAETLMMSERIWLCTDLTFDFTGSGLIKTQHQQNRLKLEEEPKFYEFQN